MFIGIDCSRAFSEQRTGTENYTYFLLKALLALPSDNFYRLYLRSRGDVSDQVFLESVRKLLPKTDNFELVIIKQKKLWTQLGLALELWKSPVELLFVPAHTLPVFRPRKIKTIVTVHDLGYEYLPEYHQFPHRLWLTYFTEYAVDEADRIIAVSTATRKDLIEKLGASKDKIVVIPEALIEHGYSESINPEALKKYQIVDPYIVFVGTVQPRKNLVKAIAAFALLKLRYPDYKKLKFVIVGKRGWLSEEIYDAPAKYGVVNDVRFLGYVADEEIMSIWSQAEMTFYATLFEGFGLPILESHRMRVPVLTSQKQPFMEVGGDACLYVNPDSIEEIAEGIANILQDGEMRVRLIENGEKNVNRFSWKRSAEDLLKLMNSIGR